MTKHKKKPLDPNRPLGGYVFKRRSSYERGISDSGGLQRRACDNGIDLRDLSWIPDWRNTEYYQGLLEQGKARIAWEFLRRNRTYQTVCDDMMRYKAKHSIDFTRRIGDLHLEEDKYLNLRALCRHETDWFQNLFTVNTLSFYNEATPPLFMESSIVQSYYLHSQGRQKSFVINDDSWRYFKMDGELTARINLNIKINDQLKKLEREIKEIDKKHGIKRGNNVSLKNHAMLIKYLRLLDVNATTKDKDDMNIINGKKSYNGKYTAANDALESALRMTEMGYRALLVSE